MRTPSRSAVLAASRVAACAASFAALRPAAAQVVARAPDAPAPVCACDVRRPEPAVAGVPVQGTSAAGAPAAGPVRLVATYRFGRRDLAALPAEVTVSDSAGQLVARYRLDGERVGHAMQVTILDTDLVLQAETRAGLLTLRLDEQNASGSGPMGGRWWLANAHGALRGRTR